MNEQDFFLKFSDNRLIIIIITIIYIAHKTWAHAYNVIVTSQDGQCRGEHIQNQDVGPTRYI